MKVILRGNFVGQDANLRRRAFIPRSPLFIVLLASLIAAGSARAIADEPVCVESKTEALGRAVKFHRVNKEILAAARAADVGDPHVRSGVGFDYEAVNFVETPSSPSALMLFAADSSNICVFIWVTGNRPVEMSNDDHSREFLYKVIPHSAETLASLSVQLRKAVVGQRGSTDRSPARRDGTSLSGFLSATTKDPEKLSFTAIQRKISGFLFPAEFRPYLERTKHLSIIPIYDIAAIPIASLSPFRDNRLVVDLFSVSFLASIDDVRLGPWWESHFSSPLVVGNPTTNSDPDWIFPDLPGAAREATGIGELFGAPPILTSAATTGTVLSRITSADLVYFAAHGISSPREPVDKGFIALANGRLTARQVQNLRFSNQPLVVLSACQTGTGMPMKAGLVGLARAFQIAGASVTVMSLWNIDDSATAVLMLEFMSLIKKEIPPAEALRRAMVEARKIYNEPELWAAFNVFGRGTRRAQRERP